MEELIREWMNEDRFLTKYTKRQRAILSNRLIQKLSVQVHKQTELEDALEEAETKTARYRKANQILLRKTYSIRWIDRITRLVWIFWICMVSSTMIRKITSSTPLATCLPKALNQTEQYKTVVPTW
jgi:hypothetical protein